MVSQEVHHVVMEGAVRHVCDQLVEGYSQTKKCSDEGRALMSLDVKTLQVILFPYPTFPLHLEAEVLA